MANTTERTEETPLSNGTKDQQTGKERFKKRFDEFLDSVGEVLNDFTALEVNTIVAAEITGAKFNPWEAYQFIYSISDKDYFVVKGIPEHLQERYTKLFEKLERDYFNLLIDENSELFNPTDEKVNRYRVKILSKRAQEELERLDKLKTEKKGLEKKAIEDVLTNLGKIWVNLTYLKSETLRQLEQQENKAKQELLEKIEMILNYLRFKILRQLEQQEDKAKQELLEKIRKALESLKSEIIQQLSGRQARAEQKLLAPNKPSMNGEKEKGVQTVRTEINRISDTRAEIEKANLFKASETTLRPPEQVNSNDDSKMIESDPKTLSEIRPILPDPVDIDDLEGSWTEMCALLDNSAFLRSLRKIIELKAALDSTSPESIDTIYAQTIVQLDGDIITRYHDKLFNQNKEKQDLILKAHNEGVTAGNQQWHGLLEFIVDLGQTLGQGAIDLLQSNKR